MKKIFIILILIVSFSINSHAWHTIQRSLGCNSKDNLSKGVRAVTKKDTRTFNFLTSTRQCIIIEPNVTVHVKKMTMSKVKIDYKGYLVWTVAEAVSNEGW